MKKAMYKVLCGVLAGGLLISGASAATASAMNNDTEGNVKAINYRVPMDKEKVHNEMKEEMDNILKEVLADEVKAGSITEEESEKVLEYLETKEEEKRENFNKEDMHDNFNERKENGNKEDMKERFNKEDFNKEDMKERVGKGKDMGSHRKDRDGRKDLFEEIVAEGILTQEKADSIKEKIHETVEENKEAQLKERLSTIVEEGTITQQQADKIEEVLKKLAEERKANFEKVKDMTDEERREYMENMREEHTNPMTQLVDDGTLTQEEAEAVKGLFNGMGRHQKGDKGGFRGSQNRGF